MSLEGAGSNVKHGDSPAITILKEQSICAPLYPEEADLAPEGSPRVPHPPELLAMVLSPTHHFDIMVDIVNGGVAIIDVDPSCIAARQFNSSKQLCTTQHLADHMTHSSEKKIQSLILTRRPFKYKNCFVD